jgi:hypothetical protein
MIVAGATTHVIVRVISEGGQDLSALVIAITGVLLGAGSLGWQLLSHQLENPRLKLELVKGWTGNGLLATGLLDRGRMGR